MLACNRTITAGIVSHRNKGNKDLLLPYFFFFFVFLGRGGGADGDVVSTCSVLQLLRHPQSLQNSEAAKICDASTEIRKLSDILRFFITCDCPILLNDVISKIRASKVNTNCVLMKKVIFSHIYPHLI